MTDRQTERPTDGRNRLLYPALRMRSRHSECSYILCEHGITHIYVHMCMYIQYTQCIRTYIDHPQKREEDVLVATEIESCLVLLYYMRSFTLCMCMLSSIYMNALSGVGAFLKSKNPDVQVVLADPQVTTYTYMYSTLSPSQGSRVVFAHTKYNK